MMFLDFFFYFFLFFYFFIFILLDDIIQGLSLWSFLFLLIFIIFIAFLFFLVPFGGFYGLALALVYVGGIAILTFFFLMVYGGWYYQGLSFLFFNNFGSGSSLNLIIYDFFCLFFLFEFIFCINVSLLNVSFFFFEIVPYFNLDFFIFLNRIDGENLFIIDLLNNLNLLGFSGVFFYNYSYIYSYNSGIFMILLGLLLLCILVNIIILFLGNYKSTFLVNYYKDSLYTGE